MRDRSLKTSQRMTEGTKKGAKEVKTGTEDEDGAEIQIIRTENRGASLH